METTEFLGFRVSGQGDLWVNNSYDHYSILTYLS